MASSIASIGQEIRRLRRARGLSAGDTARRAGLGRSTLSALENGRGNVELNSLLAICDVIGVEITFVAKEIADLAKHDGDTQLTATQARVEQLMGGGRTAAGVGAAKER